MESAQLPPHAVIELFPGNQEKKAVCMQGCTHCPARVMPTEYEKNNELAFSEESLQALGRLEVYLNTHGTTIHLMPQGIPLIDEKTLTAFPLTQTPKILSFNFGRLPVEPENVSKVTLDTLRKLLKLMPTLATKAPERMAISMFPELNNHGRMENIDGMILAVRLALKGPLKSMALQMKEIDICTDVNDVPLDIYNFICENEGLINVTEFLRMGLEIVTMDIGDEEHSPELIEKRLMAIVAYDTVDASITYYLKNYPLVYFESRLTRGGVKPNLEIPIETIERNMGIGLNPDHIWIGHSTRNVGDKSVRMTYPEFHAIMDSCEATKRPLNVAIADYVRQKRALLSEKRKTSIEISE